MQKHVIHSFVVLSILALSSAVALAESNWPRWRGPLDNGSREGGDYPSRLTGENNVLWKSPLPGKGCSTPIVWEKQIFLTAPIEGKDSLLAFDWDGEPLWDARFGDENPGKHRNGSGSNASPVTDGDGVFVYFKSGTLAAVNLDGSIRWQTNLVKRFGKDTLFWDHGTSPILTKNSVLMARMHHGESWLAAFDKRTGEMQWKQTRNFTTPVEGDHGYTTPLVIQHQGKESLLVWGAEHLTIHNTTDGKAIWTCGDFNPDKNKLWPAISTPVIAGDMAVIAFGRNDRGIPRLHGVKLTGAGEVTATNHAWKRTDVGTFVPTPIEYKGRVYLVRDRGEVVCLDPATGNTIWANAFPKNRAKYYASPTIAGGKLYAPREDGVVFVADIEKKFKLLSENEMGEPVIASPVPVANRLFIRGEEHLYCITGG